MIADQPSALTISVDWFFGPGTPPAVQVREVTRLKTQLKRVLENVPGLLIVLASGDSALNRTASDYVTTPHAGQLKAALFLLREDPAYANRILVVAGTKPGNTLWEGSNLITGLTDIAAPASDVATSDTMIGNTVPVVTVYGTSFSAPMVAGVAGLLLSMDPTLTPAQVKDYILRGAQVPRRDSLTGVATAPAPVGGIPGLYQLDAYGALQLVSQARPGTPICGYPVTGDGIYNGGYVILEKNGPMEAATDSIKVPGAAGTIGYVGVAQGGRVLSAYTQSDSLYPEPGGFFRQSIIHFNHQGQRLGALVDYWGGRHYVERYIIDHRQMGTLTSGWQQLTLRLSNGSPVSTMNLMYPDGTLVGAGINSWDLDVSPDGRFVAFRGGYVQRFDNNTTIRVGDHFGHVKWSKDGTKLVVFSSDTLGNQTFTVHAVDQSPGGGFALVETFFTATSNRFLDPWSHFSGDDAVFYTSESGQAGNFVALRPAKALGTKALQQSVVYREMRQIANVASWSP